MQIGRKHAEFYNVNEELLTNARLVYEQQLGRNFTADDMFFVEHAVALAERAGAKVPDLLRKWASTSKSVRETAAMPDDQIEKLPEFVNMIRKSKQLGLPRTADLVQLEAKAGTCASTYFKETMGRRLASTGAEAAVPTDIDTLLMALEGAHELGLQMPEVSAAEAKVKAAEAEELRQALAREV